MQDNVIVILEAIKYFITAAGLMVVAWGVYDFFSDNGNQSSSGVKRMLGGIALAAIGFIAMQLVINNIKTGLDQANSATAAIGMMIGGDSMRW